MSGTTPPNPDGNGQQPGNDPQDGVPQGGPQYGAPQYSSQQYQGQQYQGQQFAGAQYGSPVGPSQGQSRGRRVLITVVGIVVAIAVAGLVRWGFTAAFGGNAKQDMIASSVAEIRKQSDLPKQVDSVTTWTAVTAEDDAIHYAYRVSSGVDPAAVSKSSVKRSIVPTLCSTDSTRKILDDDIAMRYTYTFDGSSKTMDLTVTKADC